MDPKSYHHTGPLELVVYVAGKDPKPKRLPLTGHVTIGRGQHNNIVIEDTSVSRDHAILHLGADLRIEDKSSRNGTEVYKPGRSSGTDTTVAQHSQNGGSFNVGVGDRIKLGSVIVVLSKAGSEPEKGTSGPRMWTEAPTISDPSMTALYDEIREAADTSARAPILIFGETGAGKESVARTIHDESPRKSRPFVTVNCGQFSDTLVESALFGHVKGAFTGAFRDKHGFFDTANTGTLFLDEVAELTPEAQTKLLRVLDYGEVYPLGSTQPHYVDVRVVAATNKNLFDYVQQGKFRSDLYYRLKGFEFEVPPLRKRPKDIVPLAERFLEAVCRRDNQQNAVRFSEAAIACLQSYPFPGNVRQLKNAVEVASVRCRNGVILPEHLPPEISHVVVQPPEPESTPKVRTPAISEKELILQALIDNGFNQKQAAADLGISNRTLVNRLNKYPDIKRPKKKRPEDAQPIRDLPPVPPDMAPSSRPPVSWPHGDF